VRNRKKSTTYLSRNVDNKQDTIRNLKTEKVELKNGKTGLKKLEKKVTINNRIKLVNRNTQTNFEEEPSLPSKPLSTLLSLSKALTSSISPASDLTSASQYEDSFVEFDTRDDEPKAEEAEQIVVSNIQG
jgi:hypothetical protein